MEMINVKFMKHRLKATDKGQQSKFLRLKPQFGVLRGAEMQTRKKQFYCMIDDSKPLENEPEDLGPLLETYETSIITHWIALKIPTKHSCTFTTGFK